MIVKPFNPATFAAAALGLADAAAVRAARFDAVAKDFAASLPATLGMIAAAWEALARVWQTAEAETLLAEVHKVAGVAPMFQFRRLGKAADEAEGLLRAALKKGDWRNALERAALEGAVKALLEEGRKGRAG